MRFPFLLMGGLFLLLLANGVNAATIEGTAYDGLTLEVLHNVVVSITTSPVQTKLEQDGMYTFTVPPGTYTLRATYSEEGNIVQEASQNVVVNADGNYTIDLILLPDLGDVPDEPLPGDTPTPGWIDQLVQGPLFWMTLLGIVLIASGFAIYHVRREARKQAHAHKGHHAHEEGADGDVHLDKYAQEILNHLKRGGNRTTQKELREKMSIGEAKVSLVVSELESYGLLKKIKRGRGNILVLSEKGRAHAEKNGDGHATPNAISDEDGTHDPSTPES